MKNLIYTLIYKLYVLASPILGLLGLMYLCYKKRKDPPYGKRVCELLGHYNYNLDDSVVFHAVSVGEVIAARPLIETFIAQNPQVNVIVTTTTTTGANEVYKIKGAIHLFAPLDSVCAVRLFFKKLKPTHLFIVETELWPNLLTLAKKYKCFVGIINARMPDRTYETYLKHKNFYRYLLFKNIDLVLAQTREDKNKFIELGVADDKCIRTGSLKYDLKANEELYRQYRMLRHRLRLNNTLGAISLHDGEEELILESYFSVLDKIPDLKLIIVPRHQSGVDLTIDYLRERRISFSLRTKMNSDLSNFNTNILIGNTMGEIELYLGLCDLVFMGGSYVDIGGHNPLEPAYFSIPILTGPYFYNFKEQFENLIEAKGAFLAPDHRRLCTLLLNLFSNKNQLLEYGMNALDVQEKGRGSINRSLNYINKAIQEYYN